MCEDKNRIKLPNNTNTMITSRLCKKKVSGKIVIIGSVLASNNQKLFRKNILWNITKAASKFMAHPITTIAGSTKTVIEETNR